ncbi:MAG: site-2 protease family protein [Chloroflexi bacterium]|nr:MAG: site-2 protease family protein [Chloroflexota bacterium]
MPWSIKLGRIFGIDIKMHVTFLLILVWGAFAYGGSAGPLYGLLVTVSLFTLVLLHELGHSLAALGFGIGVRDITLLPIGGVARLERMPEKPLQELVIALAGPLVNVLLAVGLLPVVGGLGLLQGEGFSLRLFTQPGLLGWLMFLLSANVSLAVFNMLPAFPLDGGRVFRAIMAFFTDYRQATEVAANVGRALALGLGLFAIFMGQIWLALIALFIFMAGGQEAQAVAARSILHQARAGQALSAEAIALAPEATVGEAATMLMGTPRPHFVVMDPTTGQLLGVANRGQIMRAIQSGQWFYPIADIMDQARSIPVVAVSDPLDEVQDVLTRTASPIAAVYDDLHFRGLITPDDIYRLFRLLSEQSRGSRQVRWNIIG